MWINFSFDGCGGRRFQTHLSERWRWCRSVVCAHFYRGTLSNCKLSNLESGFDWPRIRWAGFKGGPLWCGAWRSRMDCSGDCPRCKQARINWNSVAIQHSKAQLRDCAAMVSSGHSSFQNCQFYLVLGLWIIYIYIKYILNDIALFVFIAALGFHVKKKRLLYVIISGIQFSHFAGVETSSLKLNWQENWSQFYTILGIPDADLV